MRERFERELLLFPEDAIALTASRESGRYFEAVLAELRKIPGIRYGTQSPDIANAKSAANWVINEVGSLLNRSDLSIEQSPVSAAMLATLLARLFDETISGKIAKDVLTSMWVGEGTADEIIDKRGLKQISDAGAIEKIVDQVLTANAKQAEDYRAGKEKAFNSLVGQVMKATQGKANPAQVNEILKRKLAG